MTNKFLSVRLAEIAEQQLQVPVDDLKYLGGGSFGKVFKATKPDGKFIVLKAYRKPNMNINEARQLNLLSENTRVKMPKVYFTHSQDDIAVMCMSYIEGKNTLNPIFLSKSKNTYENFAKDVVNGMSDWHNVTNDKYGYIDNPSYASWKDFFFEEKVNPQLNGLKKLVEGGNFNSKTYTLLCDAAKTFEEIVEEPECPVLTHCDLNIMNIMADAKTMKLTGFIDPCGSMWADKEYDLFQLQNMWGNKFKLYETYKAINKTSANCDFKIAFYGALNENACRLSGGLTFALWEMLWNNRLRKIMKKL